MPFTHLHTHSHYSLLDGLPKIDDLINRAKELGMDSLALTDHGVMYGAVEFYEKAKAAGIKPIIGIEGYLSEAGRKTKKADEKPNHQILLARNIEGYKNLMKISSIAFLEGFYYKPRFDVETLRKYGKGIIATSSCLQGIIPQTFLNQDETKAIEKIKEFQDIFGENNFYLEVQNHPSINEQVKLNKFILKVAKERKIPTIATNDVHYLKKEDAEAQDVLVCVQTGKTVDDDKRMKMTGIDVSMASEEEMRSYFPENPEVIEETAKLAAKCEIELDLGNFYFPVFELPKGVTANEHLSNLTQKGLDKKYKDSPNYDEYKERIEYELDIIKQKGYSAYFLIVADFTNWSRSQGIISTTRGSAAGSLVSHAIGITTVNPMTYQLPFERFLNPYRPSAPDIDMDFADNRRDEVLDYVRQKYGEDKVAQICTFGTMQARGAVRDVGRALGLPYSYCDRIAKLIPMGKQGFPMTIDKALDETAELKQIYNNESDAKKLLDMAKKIEGSARHPSVHAAGVVVSPTELTDFTPLQRETGGDKIITQYEMHAAEATGLVKMDFLGIRNLSILGNAIHIISKSKNIDIDIDNIPKDDPKTFKLLAAGRTMGMFQLGGGGMTRYLTELRPTKITDIMAMVALFRPGPMESIPEFIARKHNPEKISYLEPRLKTILKDSYGIITYQDDVLYTAIDIAGYNWEEADKLRKAMGKKIPEEMEKQKDKFINGCINNGKTDKETALGLWKLIEPFAAYGFNKAHAASYGIVAYQTAYLKAHFPAEFMAALMTAESDDIEKVAEAVTECDYLGIKVLPPDVNESFATFTVVDDSTIRFGLNAVKNVGKHIVEVVIEERKENGQYKNITDFLTRVTDKDLNKKSLESFIKSGSLDSLGARHTLYGNVEKLLAYAKDSHEASARNQSSLFGGGENSQEEALNLDTAPEDDRLSLSWEKELLGLYVSGHPLQKFKDVFEKSNSVIKNLKAGMDKTVVYGLVAETKEITTKKGDLMAFIRLEDLTASMELIVFPKTYAKTKSLWARDDELIVEVKGKVEERNGNLQLICNQVKEVDPEKIKANPQTENNNDQEKRPDQNLEIYLKSDTSPNVFAKLKEVLYNSPGNTKVLIHINGSKTIKPPISVSINSELSEQLATLLGQESVKLPNV